MKSMMATNKATPDTNKKSICIPYLETIGSKSIGEANCPKKKLEVSMPAAFPRLCAGTSDKNHALVFTNKSPKPMPMGAVAKKSPAMLEACEMMKSPVPNSAKVTA